MLTWRRSWPRRCYRRRRDFLPGRAKTSSRIGSEVIAWRPELRNRQRRHWFQRRNRAQRSEEHTSELQSRLHLVCRLLLEKKKEPHECCVVLVLAWHPEHLVYSSQATPTRA